MSNDMRISRSIVRSGAAVIAACVAYGTLAAQDSRSTSITLSKDVAAIFNTHCVSCHQPGEIAPMSLTTFESARPWVRSIRKAIAERTMPPWYADPTFGEFANDPRLSDKEAATIVAWIDQGATQGDPKEVPAATKASSEWKLGTPDLVLSMVAPAQVPAGGRRIIQDYPIDAKIDIPPGAPNYEAKGSAFVFAEDSHIISLLPRMNERGKDYRYTLTYPDGRSVVLLSVPKFNPDWQPSYVLKEAVAAPKGAKLETLAHYDNSAANKSNPDPTQRVIYGPEIMNGYFDYTVDSHHPRTGQ